MGLNGFKLQGGTISYIYSGKVFGTYKVLDKENIRFTSANKESPLDIVVTVKFPSSDKMVWYRIYGTQLSEWWHFERVKK